jgi:ABC transporter substrate binding protein/AAA ATPase domain
MEQMATPGTILLAPATLQLAEGYVQVAARGPVVVKGLSDPVEVYALTGASALRTRLHAAAARGLTRFVGRDAEIEQIRRALALAHEGRGQLVAVVGEPGVGKSRLVYEFTHSHRTGLAHPGGQLRVLRQPFGVRGSEEFAPTVSSIQQRGQEAIIVADDSMLRTHGRVLADLVLRSRLPSIGDREYATDGGLLAYTVNRTDVWRRAAVFIDKIFRGASPADLPFQQADRIDLLVNLKIAKALGLTIPPSLLARADQIIE